ncbi:MAG: PqqD family protein [Kiritimatiellaeota bacterium]|nr:PqqD family protein [Kiritimatiellota bacterium]
MPLFGSKAPKLSRGQAFSALPVRRPGVSMFPADGGEALLLVVKRPPFRSKWLERLAPVVRERRIELDEIGAQVWQWIDGRRTVRELVRAFSDKFDVNRREAEVAVVEFLKSLMTRGLISMEIPDGSRRDPQRRTGGGQPDAQ